MAWNLNDYETAAELNQWWIDNFPTGRIAIEERYFNADQQEVLVKASAYRDINDPYPCAENLARGKAADYPKNMQRWFVEDTTTSAIARVILLVKGATKTAHRESMMQVKGDPGHKVEHPNKPSSAATSRGLDLPPLDEGQVVTANEPQALSWDDDPVTYLTESLGAVTISDEISCAHGVLLVREGTSKAGKPYKGSMCAGKNKSDKCTHTNDGRELRDGALWWQVASNGSFYLPERR